MSINIKQVIPFLAISLAIIVIVFLLIVTRPEPATETRETPPARVETQIVSVTSLKPTRSFTGTIEPRYRSLLRFEVPGRVAQIHADTGSAVARGDALISIDDADYRDRLTEAQAALEQEQQSIASDKALLALARENVALAQKEVNRLAKLGTKLASEATLDDARRLLMQLESEFLRLEHAVNTAAQREQVRQAAVNRARRDVERTTIRAPFDGIVSKRFLSPGDYAVVNGNAIQIIDAGPSELVLHVPTTVLTGLELGQQLSLSNGQQRHSGKILTLQPDADEQTGTHRMRVEVEEAAFAPGTVMQAIVPLGAITNAITVPVSAILSDDGDDYLFIVKDERLEKRRVRLGVREGPVQVIEEGLSAGEQIVMRDVAALVDEQRVIAKPLP